jgi:HemY protein
MIRVLVFLVMAGLLALGVVWLADRPGQVAITWLDYHIDLSVMVMVVALAVLVIAAIVLWSLVRFFLRSPQLFRLAMRERKRRKGFDAISRGLIAIGAGDARAAQRYAALADKSAAGESLALLLRAQTAQMNGDRGGAEGAFRAMAERDDTRLLGLRGLFVEAQRHNDPVAARLAAEEAARVAPALAWAGQAVLEFRCAAGDWEGALAALEESRKSGALDRAVYRRRRAVLLTARAIAEEDNRDAARALVLDATRLAPELVPAAALAGRLLTEAGERRKAAKIIEAAWKADPHPDLADAYAHLRLSDSARDRLSRVQALARVAPGHVEGALAIARAALDAREFAAARSALEPLAAEPTQRVAMLMAELEELDGDAGRAREWMARALNAALDPAWTADGIVSDRWLPVSPVTGRLDAFQWKVPVAELGDRDRMPVLIDMAPRRAVVSEALPQPPAPAAEAAPQQAVPKVVSPPPDNVSTVTAPPVPAAAPAAISAPASAAAPAPASAAAPAPASAAAPAPPNTVAPRRQSAAPIIPLTQVPDDPGPEPDTESDSELSRFRQLFR